MPQTFTQIEKHLANLKRQKIVPQEVSLQEFSQVLNQITGTEDYKAGDVGKIGYGVNKFSQLISDAANYAKPTDLWFPGSAGLRMAAERNDVPLPFSLGNQPTMQELGKQGGGYVGESLFGNRELGERIGEGLPRGVANTIPALIGFAAAPATGGSSLALSAPALAGLAATAGMTGSQVFEETGSTPRALASGAVAAAMPFAAGKATSAVVGPMIKAGAPAWLSGAASIPASIAGGAAMGVVGDVADIGLAPERSMAEMGTKEYWQGQALMNMAFLPLDIQQGFKMAKSLRPAGKDVDFEQYLQSMEGHDLSNETVMRVARAGTTETYEDRGTVEGDLLSDFNVQRAPVIQQGKVIGETQTLGDRGRMEGDLLDDFGIQRQQVVEPFQEDLPTFVASRLNLNKLAGIDQAQAEWENWVGAHTEDRDIPLDPSKYFGEAFDGTQTATLNIRPQGDGNVLSTVTVTGAERTGVVKVTTGDMLMGRLVEDRAVTETRKVNEPVDPKTPRVLDQPIDKESIPFASEDLPKTQTLIEEPIESAEQFTTQLKALNKERAEQDVPLVDNVALGKKIEALIIEDGEDAGTAVQRATQEAQNETQRIIDLRAARALEDPTLRNDEFVKAGARAAIESNVVKFFENPHTEHVTNYLLSGASKKPGPIDYRWADNIYYNDLKEAHNDWLSNPKFEGKSEAFVRASIEDDLRKIKERARYRQVEVPTDLAKKYKDKPYFNYAETQQMIEKVPGLEVEVDYIVRQWMDQLESLGASERVTIEATAFQRQVGRWIRDPKVVVEPKAHLAMLNKMVENTYHYARKSRATEAFMKGLTEAEALKHQKDLDEVAELYPDAGVGFGQRSGKDYKQEGVKFVSKAQHDQARKDNPKYDAMILGRVIMKRNGWLTGVENVIQKNEKGQYYIGNFPVRLDNLMDVQALKNILEKAGITQSYVEALEKAYGPMPVNDKGQVLMDDFVRYVDRDDFVRTVEHGTDPAVTGTDRQIRIGELQHEHDSVLEYSQVRASSDLMDQYIDGAWNEAQLRNGLIRLEGRLRLPADIVESTMELAKLMRQEREEGTTRGVGGDPDFANQYRTISPDPGEVFNPKTGLGNTAFDVRIKGLKVANHPDQIPSNSIGWVRGKFIDVNGERVFRLDELQPEGKQKYDKKTKLLKEGKIDIDDTNTLLFIGKEITDYPEFKLEDLGLSPLSLVDRQGVGKFTDKRTNLPVTEAEVRRRALVRHYEKDGHPFLKNSENILLRAVVEHAAKYGANKIFLPDSKTVMFSEQHHQYMREIDWLEKPTYLEGLSKFASRRGRLTGKIRWDEKGPNVEYVNQYGEPGSIRFVELGDENKQLLLSTIPNKSIVTSQAGMAQSYDQLIPTNFKKITGQDGVPIDLGPHHNVAATRPETYSDLGTPNTTGRLYDITSISQKYGQLSGVPLLGNVQSFSPQTLHPIQHFLQRLGFTPKQSKFHYPAVLALAKVHEYLTGRKLSAGQVIGRTPDGQLVAGLANRSVVHQQMFLNPELHPRLAEFTAAHEAMGHHLMNAYKAGILDAQTSRAVAEAEKFWTDLHPLEREQFFADYGQELLGKKLYSELSEDLRSSASDPVESIANLFAMLAKDSVSKSVSFQRLSFLPQPVLDFVMKAIGFAKDMFRAATKWAAFRRWNGDLEINKVDSMANLRTMFETNFKKFNAENQQNIMEGRKLGLFFPGVRDGMMDAGMIDGSQLTYEGNVAMGLMADAMLIPGRKKVRDLLKKTSNFWEAMVGKLGRHPIVDEYGGAAARNELSFSSMMGRQQAYDLYGDYSKPKLTGGMPALKEAGPVMRVLEDKGNMGLRDRFNDLWLLQDRGVFMDKSNFKDPMFEPVLKGLKDEQIKDILEANARFKKAIEFSHSQLVGQMKLQFEASLAKLVRDATTLPQGEVYKLGRDLAQAYREGAALKRAGDPLAFAKLEQLIATNKLNPNVFLPVLGKRMASIEKVEAFFVDYPHYVPVRNWKRYMVTYAEKGSKGNTKRWSSDDVDLTLAKIKELKAQGATMHYPGLGYLDVRKAYGKHPEPLKVMDELLEAASDQSLGQTIRELLNTKQISKDVAMELIGGLEAWKQALNAELEDIQTGKLMPSDDPNFSRQDANFYELAMMYMTKVARLAPRRVTDTILQVERKNPEIMGDQRQVDMLNELEQHVKNLRIPDSDLGRALVTGNFAYFLLASPSNTMIEMAQFPLSVSHIMTRNGFGLFNSYKLPLNAARKLIPFYLKGKLDSGMTLTDNKGRPILHNGKPVDAYEALLQLGVERGHIGFGKQQDVKEAHEQMLENLSRIAEGKSPLSSSNFLSKTWAQIFNLGAKLYQIGPALNERISYIAFFDAIKQRDYAGKKTFTSDEFQKIHAEVEKLSMQANQSGGRFQRPQGFFNQGTEWRTIPMMMQSLNTYNSGLLSALYTDLRVGFAGKNLAGFTAKDRANHRLAAMQAFATLTAGAGVLGALPFAGAFMKLLEDNTDLEIEKNLRLGLLDLGGEKLGPYLADFAEHGAAYAAGLPFDMSGRVAVGGLAGFNEYEGWSAKALMGPTMSRIADYLEGGGNVLKGDLTKATEKFLPVGLKKGWQLMTKHGTFTDSTGKVLLNEPTFAEQSMYALGFAPRKLTAMRELQRIETINERVNASRNHRFYRDMSAKMEKEGPASIVADIEQYKEDNPGLDEQAIYSGITEHNLRKQFGRDPRHDGTKQGALDKTKLLKTYKNHDFPEVGAVDLTMQGILERMRMGQFSGSPKAQLKSSMIADVLQQGYNISFPQARAIGEHITSRRSAQRNPGLLGAFLDDTQ